MKRIRHSNHSYALFFSFLLLAGACKKNSTGNTPEPDPDPAPVTSIAIALAGNGYVTTPAAGSNEAITDNGLGNWTNSGSITTVYFKTEKSGQLHVAVKAKVPAGKSQLKVTVNGTAFTIDAEGDSYKSYFAGTVQLTAAGYNKVELQGISKTGSYFADVSDVLIGGSATTEGLAYANDPANYYWSRRGPSCHLGYTLPGGDKEYFYSELTVPEGEDKTGSYFMANGFGEGYFGIQVNSAAERRVLFSVWDPSGGQTTLVRKGDNVTAGRFGGEGTGGQSYLLFNWKAGTTYKFLTHGKPDGAGSTIYTSWFFAPEAGNWQLIASWKRPATSTYLTNFHGFLENFYPTSGHLGRKAWWSNQWVRMADGNWSEITGFRFTVDATGTNKQRLDFAGGSEGNRFFLQNGGFFYPSTAAGTTFSRSPSGQAPVIDLSSLP